MSPPATPQATRPPTAPTSEPRADLPDLPLDAVHIEDCRISGDLGKSGFSGQGTAPAPTPIPAPVDGSRPPELIEKELTEFRREIDPVAATLGLYDVAFRHAWPLASTKEKQAAQLHTYGNRLAQLCSAASQLKIPREVFVEVFGLGESVRARYAWITVVLDELVCCDNARAGQLNEGFISTSEAIELAIGKLADFFATHAVSEGAGSERSVTNDRFGLTMTIPGDAVVVRNTIDVLVAFVVPLEILDPASLGPGIWKNGTALRIRRLRNRSELTVAQAAVEHEGILARFGELHQTQELDIPDFDEIQFSYSTLEGTWSGTTTVFVLDGHTYIVELMCGNSEPDLCALARTSVESMRLVR